MIITKKALSRRTALKALGVALPLPLLDAMVPASTPLARTPAKPAMRFGAVYVPWNSFHTLGSPMVSSRGASTVSSQRAIVSSSSVTPVDPC